MASIKEIIVVERASDVLLQDCYTRCLRCDTSIPKGIKDYCSPDCELGNKKLNI